MLGQAWADLHPNLQSAHHGGRPVHLVGTLRIRRGTTPLARLLLTLMRMPGDHEPHTVELHISSDNGVETWRRSIGDYTLLTTQYIRDELLAERIGMLEFCFTLAVSRDWLRYDQQCCRLRIGGISLRLSSRIAPQVWALERRGESERCTHIHVVVSVPFVGFLFSYEGYLFDQENMP